MCSYGAECEQSPSLNDLFNNLDFIKEHWYSVGEALKVPDEVLRSLKDSNNDQKENLENVIVKWVEQNQARILLLKIIEELENTPIVNNNNLINEKLQKLKLNNVNNVAPEHEYEQQQHDQNHVSEDEEEDVAPEHRNEQQQYDQNHDSEDKEEDVAPKHRNRHKNQSSYYIKQQHGQKHDSEDEQGQDDHMQNKEEERQPRRSTLCCYCYGFAKCLFSWKTLGWLIKVIVVAAAIWMAVYRVATYPEKTDELDRLLLENQEMADKMLHIGVREIRILVTGKTGTGKSSLINGIIGESVTEEGGSLDPTTIEVEHFKRVVRGIPMVVFDSPGLQDGTENEKEYLLDMERKCKKVDLVLYTLKMSDKRLHADDVEAMKKLTNAFGCGFWENVVFVMTFANEIRDPGSPDEDDKNRLFFEERLSKWEKKLPDTLVKELNVSRKIAKNVPIIPAGYYKNAHLPGRRFWFSQFWSAVLTRMEECSKDGYSFMLRFNKDRFRRVYEVTPEDLAKAIHEQPIVITAQGFKKSSSDHIVGGAVCLLSAYSVLLWLM